jgi:GT2 family glycosyltransferase
MRGFIYRRNRWTKDIRAFSRKFCFQFPVRQPLQAKECIASVVIPVRDRVDLLKRCLDAIRSQDYPAVDFEVIVCDDGSIRDLSTALEKPQPGHPDITLVRQDCRGPAAARNLGIRASASPIVLFIDSDTVAEKGLVRNLVSALLENPDWAGAEACLLPIEGDSSPLWEAPGALKGGRYHTAAIAYRRDALVAAGGLDESFLLAACEDVELAARVLSAGPIGFVPEAKAYHPRRKVDLRIHWRSRLQWKYLMILAERYGFLAFPERKIKRFSRLRIAAAALITLPFGRMRQALRWIKRDPSSAALAALYALFDVACGLWALPGILFCTVPDRIDYLRRNAAVTNQSLKAMQSECRQ